MKVKKPLYKTKNAPPNHKESLDGYPSAGPYPNITGMKNLYWGIDSYTVKCGPYVYKVPYNVWVRY